jgi:transposase
MNECPMCGQKVPAAQRRYTRRGPVLLEEVARVYREAFEAGENPTAAVQNMRPPTGYSTAAAWVRQARKAGLLPPAVKGRPGWKDEPA